MTCTVYTTYIHITCCVHYMHAMVQYMWFHVGLACGHVTMSVLAPTVISTPNGILPDPEIRAWYRIPQPFLVDHALLTTRQADDRPVPRPSARPTRPGGVVCTVSRAAYARRSLPHARARAAARISRRPIRLDRVRVKVRLSIRSAKERKQVSRRSDAASRLQEAIFTK